MDRRAQRIRETLLESFDEPLTVAELAEKVNLSTRALERVFLQEFGISVKEFQIRQRLARARQLLEETDKRVSEVCYEVGFNTHSSFTRLFKRRFGVPPKRYRELRAVPT